MKNIPCRLFFIILSAFFIVGAQDSFAGDDGYRNRYKAELVDVIDGDTLRVKVDIWVGQSITTLVRIHGIDTPELRSSCKDEKVKALSAKTYLQNILIENHVYLSHIQNGKYAGRILADVHTLTGQNIADLMLQNSFAVAYTGKTRQSWC